MTRKLGSIMLVEDCEADNYLHRKIIVDVGAAEEVIVARTGNEALQRITQNQIAGAAQPELILLDINTPGMEGWDFIEEFEKLEPKTKEGTVIVMLTGSLDPDDRKRARGTPLIKEFRSKPLSREALSQIVTRHFSPDSAMEPG